MNTLSALSFKSRNAGKPTRANIFYRVARRTRRKLVAWVRLQAVAARNHAQRADIRLAQFAKRWDVPIDPIPMLPPIPTLPGDDWVELKQGMGDLIPAVVKESVVVPAPT